MKLVKNIPRQNHVIIFFNKIKKVNYYNKILK